MGLFPAIVGYVRMGAATARPVDSASEAAVLPFRARVEAAIASSERSTQTQETLPMRSVETMTEARAGIAEVLAKIQAVLPEDRQPEFAADSKKLRDLADTAIAAQGKLDSQKAAVQGDRYVKPEPAQGLADIITHRRKGDEIHYSRHDATGAYQTVAFIDRGKEIDVRDWGNSASINAALALASQKWETPTINGSDEYKEKAAQLAAEHGYKIANAELRDRIAELRRGRTEPGSESEAPKHADDRSSPGQTDVNRPDGAGAEASPVRTPAEREIALGVVRERIEGEADCESRQAARAEAAHERNPAEGSAQTPFRSQEQAEAARELRRALENDPQPSSDIITNPTINSLGISPTSSPPTTFARRLKTLNDLTPCEFVCKRWTTEPERFRLTPLSKCRD
jgi:hypothetical protein